MNKILSLFSLSLVLASLNWGCGEASSSQQESLSNPNPNVKVIPLDLSMKSKDQGGLIAVDVNNNNQKDFIITQSRSNLLGQQQGLIQVYDHSGQKLWEKSAKVQLTTQAESEGLPGLHAPGVQAADVNGDGKIEVLFLTTDKRLQIVEGETGQTIREIQLTSPEKTKRWEHLVIANFRGKGDRDLLLQATENADYRMGRYIAAYSIEDLLKQDNPQPLWTRDDFVANAHNGARVGDLDGDGLDEVLGGTLISPKGDILFSLPLEGHLDSVFIADVRPDIPGLEVVGLEEGGEKRENAQPPKRLKRNRVFLYNKKGLIWETDYKNWEPQNAAVGDFDPSRPGLEIWCRSRFNTDQKPFVFDAKGQLISNYEFSKIAPEGWTQKGVEVIFPIDWTGEAKQLAAAKERHEQGDVAIFDPLNGEYQIQFPEQTYRLYVADVSGDWREELIVLSTNELRIYHNPEPNPNPKNASLWEQNRYRRSKMTWNYYSP
ncbi:rhamnogalacturonan lyase family protein [Planktothrix mougeotii]|uniref:Rhamnogalacturonan lyase family 11 C-terminal domain-containing protein n=1 Tax=Planktothrix mougeotii LEGE 06226 TaxID=1828728 RepID=A0ABR9UDK3_9CYAN|nr:hypothetical protein [Planktothrix mougeotii]MBE9144534.1 hypothetical protein [Planktothrix mougeotii LEGE 06226]